MRSFGNLSTPAAGLAACLIVLAPACRSADFSGYLEHQEAERAASRAAAEVNQDMQRARAGDVESQYRLGTAYRKGWGVPVEPAAAANWLREAADRGHSAAQHALGSMYEVGEGIPRDEARALEWYRRAARQGHMGAQVALATLMVNSGRGELGEAYMWFGIAAVSGDVYGARGMAALEPLLPPEALEQARKRSKSWVAAPER